MTDDPTPTDDKPAIQLPGVTVWHGDCIDVLRGMPDNSVDAIVTDPPYGLEFMGKAWDAPWKDTARAASATVVEADEIGGFQDGAGGNAYSRSRVRTNTARHGGDVRTANRGFQDWCEQWTVECLRVLKPGGHMLAFGGTRTWHRLAVAVEDAGFEIRDSIAWLYGSGFPKSLDVGKAIDKAAGAQREVIGTIPDRWAGKGDVLQRAMQEPAESVNITVPASDAARQWDGWGTALKPAFEPVVVARKPLTGTVAANVTEWGTGGLNIDACRVGTDELAAHGGGINGSGRTYGMGAGIPAIEAGSNPHTGRWPANVALDDTQAAALDQQTGQLTSGRMEAGTARSTRQGDALGTMPAVTAHDTVGDTGGASRFFPTFRYQAKAPTRERPSYTGDDGAKVSHATVKPVELMRWLVRLVTPPGGTVLDPFAGSGTTLEAARLEGFTSVGIERETDYLPLIVQRLTRDTPEPEPVDEVEQPAARPSIAGEQAGLFDLMPGSDND